MAGAATAPAAAVQADPVSIDVFVPDVVVSSAGGGTASLTIYASESITLEDARYVFELGGLAGVASVDPDHSDCATSGGQLVCEETFPWDIEPGGLSLLDIEFTADPAAVPGDTGVLEVTVEAAGIAAASYESTVTVGVPADLVGGGAEDLTVEVGDTVDLPWTVRNDGPDPAEGVALQLFWDITFDAPGNPNNCGFDEGFPGMLCTFDAVLEPGQTYTFGPPLQIEVGADTGAPGAGTIEAQWGTLTEADAWLAERESRGRTITPGSGPELTLVETGGGTPAPVPADPVPAADPDPGNNWMSALISVEGDNRPDFAAIGAELEGEAGATVSVEIGVENLGPATANATRSGEPANWVLITVPVGTAAVEVPQGCSSVEDGVYLCFTDSLLRVGENHMFAFVLRVDEVIADATGLVEVNRSPADPTEGTSFTDANPDNDAAEIVMNPTGGVGGGLPVTGLSTALLAGAGVLLVVLGGLGVLLFRRRRVQFQA